MSDLQFGTAVRDITPSYPVWLYGYGDRDHKSDSVADPISLGCLAVRNGENTVLLVTCDMVGIQDHVCQRLYDLLEREVGIEYPNALFACSHTHFAPALHAAGYGPPDPGMVEPDPRFVQDFEAKLVEAAQECLRDIHPGRLERTRINVPQVLFNRRTVQADSSVRMNLLYPLDADRYRFSPIDPEMTVLRLVDDVGVGAVLINFGCHPVTGGETREQDHYKISADYVQYLRRTIVERHACPVFFTLGGAGDAVPINRYSDSRQRIGSILGNAAILAERRYAVDTSSMVSADYLDLQANTILETDADTAEEAFEQARAAWVAVLEQGDTSPDEQAYQDAARAYQEKKLALTRSRLYPQNRHTIKVQFMQIGSTVLVALPFEVLSEIGLTMKERFPDSVLVSCAGGYQGYLPLAYEYDRGGYEASTRSSHFEIGTADRLLQRILERLEN